jgi:hypothetical protein
MKEGNPGLGPYTGPYPGSPLSSVLSFGNLTP